MKQFVSAAMALLLVVAFFCTVSAQSASELPDSIGFSDGIWAGDICCQTFVHGFAAAEGAQRINVQFFPYAEGKTAPSGGTENNPNWQPATSAYIKTEPVSVLDGSVYSLHGGAEKSCMQEASHMEEEWLIEADTPAAAAVLTPEEDSAGAATLIGNAGASGGKTTKTYFLGMELTPALRSGLIISSAVLGILSVAVAVTVIISMVVVKRSRAFKAGDENPGREGGLDAHKKDAAEENTDIE
ncbi:MAG: hypothetical protein ACOYKJ_08410 [Candidatus Howiella sp.]|jgi:hypothetical protein